MTPKFITSCYVRIEDKDKRKEVCEKLERIGYENTWHSPLKNQIIVANISGTYVDVLSVDNTDMINCGTNIDLFLAFAGMREDTDKDQIFIANKDTEAPPLIWGEMFRCSKEKCDGFVFQDPRPRGKEYFIGMGLVRRVTATDIINHHKQKGE